VSTAGDRLQGTARQAALALPDVSHGRPFTPVLDVYKVAGKVFLIITDDPDEQIITVKCEPEHARAQQRGYSSITPGRYLDKRHWISLGPGPGITQRLVTDAVENSYDLVVERLPRRDRPGAIYRGCKAAHRAALRTGSLMPPAHILNAPTRLMKDLGYGKDYQYDPDTADGFSGADYFPSGMDRETYYQPTRNGYEFQITERLRRWAALRARRQRG
jgi:predicted DNA-binding protein (MmcQ/YjbR family)